MDITLIEHLTAPRLEADVQGFFTKVRFASSDPEISHKEQEKNLKEQWVTVFLDYFKDWNNLMYSHRNAEFSFWIAQFRRAYFFVLQQAHLNMHYFVPNPQHTEKWLIDRILVKLKELFKTTGFHEILNQGNDKYEKRVDQLRERYSEVSKFSVDAPDLRFYLSYPVGTELLQSVDQVIQSFRAFEKKLKSQPWFHAQVIFSYYHLIRDSFRNCYVIRFYLTFQKVFYSGDIDYSILIQQLWQESTHGIGTLLQFTDEAAQDPLGNPFGLGRDEIVEFPEPKNPLEDLGDLPATISSVDEKMNKICIMPRGFRIFHGKKVRCSK